MTNKIYFDPMPSLGCPDRAGVDIAVPPVSGDVSSQQVGLSGAPGLVKPCSDAGAVGLTFVSEGKHALLPRLRTTENMFVNQ